eukprot:TRINITY_DN46995_c0_g1_i1.p1 TRINITY_DN46995_c0_g1~~TRINITY_DN46995_c0_g1_i1.p1  ORF type:complete len:352 (-),score=69.72 TRINITY_DN46995_c0_g1_i1:111-1073(-)
MAPTAAAEEECCPRPSIWPLTDLLRLAHFLGAKSCAALRAVNVEHNARLANTVGHLRQFEEAADAETRQQCMQACEVEEALRNLESLLEEAQSSPAGLPPSEAAAAEQLANLEVLYRTEMRYVHGPDWEITPGRLISRKGTWLKVGTRFSWELGPSEKTYVPQGVALPVMQIGRVTDPAELNLHEWASQHYQVWLKPPVLATLEARKHRWFVYWPHWEEGSARGWEGEGTVIFCTADTWLKRSTHMSGELQPFELIYVTKGMMVRLARDPEEVDEAWEKGRHAHVDKHRKLTLDGEPLTMRREKYDIFVGQPEPGRTAVR